jgi:hypothetical protein
MPKAQFPQYTSYKRVLFGFMEQGPHIAGIQGNGTKPMTIGNLHCNQYVPNGNNSAHVELTATVPGGTGDGGGSGGSAETSGALLLTNYANLIITYQSLYIKEYIHIIAIFHQAVI